MRVVILPENVSVFDIKRIENRYQLQDEGKSEYHGLNRSLTLRANINDGYSLEAQLLDDPQHADKTATELKKAVKEFKSKYLNPLECADRYLKTFEREGLYNTISEGAGDKEGRWQAFIDYSMFYDSTLNDPYKRSDLGVKENEVGLIENAIFKIIRKRNLRSKELEKTFGKLHAFVRGGNLKKYLGSSDAKKYIIQIAKNVDDDILESEKVDKNGNRATEREIDSKWAAMNESAIANNLMQAYKIVFSEREGALPLELLNDAFAKLNHENLQVENMDISYHKEALELSKKISLKAQEIYEEIDHARFVKNKSK